MQRALVDQAREAAARLGIEVTFTYDDARRAPIDDGTVFYLHAPFTGHVLAEVLGRLRAVAARHAIVVGALGVDLEWDAPWLRRRAVDSFWLAIYDSAEPGVPPRRASEPSPLGGPAAEAVANDARCPIRFRYASSK